MARFWQLGIFGGGLCEMKSGAVPLQAEPVPAGSKTDPPLAKAEPISNTGGTSVI